MTDRILFVCSGNTCRSPMAAAALQHLCREAGGHHIEAASAGLFADEDATVTEQARTVLGERGIRLLRLRSQPLTPKLVNRSDLIVTMTPNHRNEVIRRFAQARLKTVSLMDFADQGPDHVPDPFGGDLDAYRQCLQTMMPALEELARQRLDARR